MRRYPPEREPERFERVRAAYEALRDPRRRLQHALFNRAAPEVEEVLECLKPAVAGSRPSLDELLAVLGGH